MTNPLVVGVDIHRKNNVVSMMDQQGQQAAKGFRVENNRPGCAEFVQQVAQQVVQGDFDAIQIGAEATGWYWWHFFQTLRQAPQLTQWPVQLYAFNPRLTASYKKTFSDLDHADPIDAFVVADRLRIGRELPVPFELDESYFALRLLTRQRFRLVHNLAREKAYCLTVLYLKVSEYSRKDKKAFSNVFGAASRAVLQEFASIEEIAAIPFDELVEFIDAKGKRRFPDPVNNTRKLRQIAQDSYSLPKALQEPVNTVLDLSLRHLAFLERQEKRINTAIAECIQPIQHTLDTIPGIGPVFSSGIIAEIGGIERFDYNQAKVAKYAGLKWRRHQSDEFEAQDTPMTRSRNVYLRYHFCEAAFAVSRCDREYAAYYQRKHDEVPKHKHKRAIVLTARKLVRLVVRLLTTNQPYRPRRRS
ncbi:MAG: IS110 family transposase [Anaerolineales bacterium]